MGMRAGFVPNVWTSVIVPIAGVRRGSVQLARYNVLNFGDNFTHDLIQVYRKVKKMGYSSVHEYLKNDDKTGNDDEMEADETEGEDHDDDSPEKVDRDLEKGSDRSPLQNSVKTREVSSPVPADDPMDVAAEEDADQGEEVETDETNDLGDEEDNDEDFVENPSDGEAAEPVAPPKALISRDVSSGKARKKNKCATL